MQKITERKNGTLRIETIFEKPSMTKQEFKDDCDPTKILRKFAMTGNLEHSRQYEAQYGETSSLTYHEAKQLTAKAETMFQELPSATRKQFNHKVDDFLDWVADPKNAEKLEKLGELDLEKEPEKSQKPADKEPEKTQKKEAVKTPAQKST